jgi:hypothetical protein
MRVEMNGQRNLLAESLDQSARGEGAAQAGHVFDREDVRSHFFQLLRKADVVFQRIFRALSEAVTRTKKRLQIVVIDHVGEAYWKGIPNIHVIERWRGDDALIPSNWLHS